jgi:ABC-2 type transport system ATP-binding protein
MAAAAIELEHLSKRFEKPLARLRRLTRRPGPDVVDALVDISLRVEQGEVFGLVGRNGQGKTTLIKSACGLLSPTRGHVRVFGYHSVDQLREVKRRVGLVSADERSFYLRLSGRDNLLFFGRLLGLAERELALRIEQLTASFELGPVLARPFQEYSSGNKQRLSIARALLADPPLLLLDEPTRSLDPISAEGLRALVRAWAGADGGGKTVLITTHNLAEIEQLCGRVAILSRGRLIECATLAALKEKYVGEETVSVRVAGVLPEAALGQLAQRFNLDSERLPDAELRLVLKRQSGDERLDALLRALFEHGLVLRGCDTQHFGLMQVLSRIEAEQGAA